jgi:hypothetical protein
MPGQTIPQPQYKIALQRANEVRTARAQLKRDVRDGAELAATVIADPPEFALTMTVAELLAAQRQWGVNRARKHCRRVAVAEGKPLGELTARQRAVITFGLPSKDRQSTRSCRRNRRADGHSCMRPDGHDGECVTVTHQHGVTMLMEAQASCLSVQN